MARLGGNWVGTGIDANAGMTLVTEALNIADLTKVIGTAPLGVGSITAGLNLAQVRVIHINYVALASEAYYLLTSSEYYYNSILLTVLKDAANFAPLQGSVSLANATYGAVWNFWPFKAAETVASTKISAQAPETVILVGVKGG